MTYEERTTQAMKMTLEELIFSYHWAMDTAENRLKTIHALRDRCEELLAGKERETGADMRKAFSAYREDALRKGRGERQ